MRGYMLEVVSPSQAHALIADSFSTYRTPEELIPTKELLGRILARDVESTEYLPPFDRSSVDGYALYASDSFGASDAFPAILPVAGSIMMGEAPLQVCKKGSCWAIPTGGALPEGADAVVMIEHTEDYGDGSIGVLKAVAPGENMLFKGDEVSPGSRVISAGTKLKPHHKGALDALGIDSLLVSSRPVVGVISTGDELIAPSEMPKPGQIRDVNAGLLEAGLREAQAQVKHYGIVKDEASALRQVMEYACVECDLIMLSGGSSVGEKDAAFEVLDALGEVLFHGIAMKPGKPTLAASCQGVPVFGLPGHPVAAYFVFLLYVRPLIASLQGGTYEPLTKIARLELPIPSNHGRAEYVPVTCRQDEKGRLLASPLFTKSGLISLLAQSDGFIEIARDSEGLAKGAEILVRYY